MLYRMWFSGPNLASEHLEGVGVGGASHIRMECGAIDDVNSAGKQTVDIALQAGIVERVELCIGCELDHDIQIAGWPGFVSSHRPEQCCMTDAASLKRVG